MDQYLILIQLIQKAMASKDNEIRGRANDLFYKKNEIETHTKLKQGVDEKIEMKETQKEILENFKQIIINLKKKFAIKVALKSLLVIIATTTCILATSTIPGANAFIYLISALLEAAIISSEISHYQVQSASYYSLYERTSISVLDNELKELREASRGLGNRIEKLKSQESNIQRELDGLKSERAELSGQYNSVVMRRISILEQNSPIAEEDLNQEYLNDQEVLKLERKLKNGENV